MDHFSPFPFLCVQLFKRNAIAVSHIDIRKHNVSYPWACDMNNASRTTLIKAQSGANELSASPFSVPVSSTSNANKH